MPDIIDSSELAKFREQWKAEVRQRKTLDVASSSTSSQDVSAVHEAREQSTPTASRTEATASYIRPNHPSVSAHTFKSLSSAVDIYRLAVQHEQSESLDDALRLYRHAFRLDTNVDKAYQKDELLAVRKLEEGSRADHDQHHNALSFDNSIGELDSWRLSSPQKINTHTGSLANIISSFSHELNFEPEDEKAGVPLRLLPDELLVLILRTLEPVSIERFALINKKARTLTLDPVIWRYLVQNVYVPPQIPEDTTFENFAGQYLHDYRRFYVEHPRLRLDGVYIAVCHYVRPGSSENAWVQVSHLITYHRYLRFFPDGRVISLLANDELEPQTIISSLKPSLRMKGFFIGNWLLVGATIIIRDLTDPSGHNLRYTFQMTLTLRSRPTGRWNKLDLAEYNSVDSKSGEATPVTLKHERPFWFSKVRSYSY